MIEKIQANFNNASKTYEAVASVQKIAAKFLVQKVLDNKIPAIKNILDLGTGTGYIPELLLPAYPNSYYVLNDIAQQMLEVCKTKFDNKPNFTFLQGDMSTIKLPPAELIISNFAMQWIDNLAPMLQKCYEQGEKCFAFSTLLSATFQEWEDILEIKINHYPKQQQLLDYCQEINTMNCEFNSWAIEIPATFLSLKEFIYYLKTLGANSANVTIPIQKLRNILKTHNSQITVSYQIFFGIFKKAN